MKKVFKVKAAVIALLSVAIVICLTLFGITVAQADAQSEVYTSEFKGLSENLSEEELYSATNTYNYADGKFQVNSSGKNEEKVTPASQIYVLTHGFGGAANHWSNGEGNTFCYKSESLISLMADSIKAKTGKDAKILWNYYVKVTENNVEKNLLTFMDISAVNEQAKANGTLKEGMVYKNADNEAADGVPLKTLERLSEEYAESPLIIVYSSAVASGKNDDIYTEFNHMLSKIVYDVKSLNGGELPQVNLIGHSRGGITNMQYTLDHPDLVQNLISLGTPYFGSNTASTSLARQFNDGAGIDDIINKDVYEGYMHRWNTNYQLYEHIAATAMGGYSDTDYFFDLIKYDANLKKMATQPVGDKSALMTEEMWNNAVKAMPFLQSYLNWGNLLVPLIATGLKISTALLANPYLMLVGTFVDICAMAILPSVVFNNIEYYVDLVSAVAGFDAPTKAAVREFIPVFKDILYNEKGFCRAPIYNGDLLVELPSQLAYKSVDLNYTGFKQIKKQFFITDVLDENGKFDGTKLNLADLPAVVHNLQTQNGEMIDFVLAELFQPGSEFRISYRGGNPVNVASYRGQVSGHLDMSPRLQNEVPAIGDGAFANNFGDRDIDGITIASQIKVIGQGAFLNSDKLTAVNFESGSRLTRIAENAFSGCSNLPEITIPQGVTEIGENAFAYCDKLEKVIVENGNTAYSSEDGVLYNSDKTVLIYYPQNKTDETFTVPSSVTHIEKYAFRGNKHINTVNMQSVQEVGLFAFVGCENLENVNAGENTDFFDNPLIGINGLKFRNASFQNSDKYVTVEDLQFDNGLTLLVDKTADYVFNIDEKEIFVMAYESHVDELGNTYLTRVTEGYSGDKLVAGQPLVYKLTKGVPYVFYLLDDYSAGAKAVTYNLFISRTFEKMPDEGVINKTLNGQECEYYEFGITEFRRKNFEITGDLDGLQLIILNEAFQPLAEYDLKGNSFKTSYAFTYHLAAGKQIYYVAINNALAVNTGAKSVELSISEQREITENLQSTLEIDDAGKGYLILKPQKSGIYYFSADAAQNFTVSIYSSSANHIYYQISVKNDSTNFAVESGKIYVVEFTGESKSVISFEWYFNPARVYLNDNLVQITEGASYLFIPKLSGVYSFDCDAAFTVNGVSQTVLTLTEGNRYYIEFTGSASALNGVLNIGIVCEELSLNSHLAADATVGSFYKFVPAQSGNYKFTVDCAENTQYDLYDGNFNLLVNGVSGQASAVLEAGETYYLRVVSSENYGVCVSFAPPQINVNNRAQIKGEHWYKFIPKYSEDYLVYVLSKQGVTVKVYGVDLQKINEFRLSGKNSFTLSLINNDIYYYEILPDDGEELFAFVTEYANPANHKDETALEVSEGVNNSVILVQNGVKLLSFTPQTSGNYNLRILKSPLNDIQGELIDGETHSQLQKLGSSSDLKCEFYLPDLEAENTYYVSINSDNYDTLTLIFVYEYENILISALDGNGEEKNVIDANGELVINDLYVGAQYSVGLTGSVNGNKVRIPYDLEYDVMSYNGHSVYASVSSDGWLKINESAPIDCKIILRVTCAYREYVAVFNVVYPVEFTASLTDDKNGLVYHLSAENKSDLEIPGCGVTGIRVAAYDIASGMELMVLTSSVMQYDFDFTSLNYFGDVKFECEIVANISGGNYVINLEEILLNYRTNCSVYDYNMSSKNSNRMIMDIANVSFSSIKSIGIPSNIKTINIKSSTGAQVKNLRFVINSSVTINLYNVNIKANYSQNVFYTSENGNYAITINALGVNTLVGGDQPTNLSSNAAQAICFANCTLRIETGKQGVINLYGGNGANGVNGSNGRKGSDGAAPTEACQRGNYGGLGFNGEKGGDGGNGASSIKVASLYASGSGSINIYGGAGGNGGTGGRGGDGGSGGRGGDAGFFNQAGTGGTGGAGGMGGHGGTGGLCGIPYEISSINGDKNIIRVYMGACGVSGNGGDGGTGGRGGDGGNNTAMGTNGKGGNGGMGGIGGNAGVYYHAYFKTFNNNTLSIMGGQGEGGSYGNGGMGGMGGNNDASKKGVDGKGGAFGTNLGSTTIYL